MMFVPADFNQLNLITTTKTNLADRKVLTSLVVLKINWSLLYMKYLFFCNYQ